jgi:hypothetical protein
MALTLKHQKIAVKDSRMALLASPVRRWHPMLCGQNKQVFQPKTIFRGPIDYVGVCAVHLVIVDDVLALENHNSALAKNARAFHERSPVVRFEFIIAPVTSEPLCHHHPAIPLAALPNVSQEWRIEYNAANMVVWQRYVCA